jgi:hypothetical protein
MSKNQDRDENLLEDCSFQLTVKGGTAALKVEGTLGTLAEAFANVALQHEEFNEVLKMAAYMLFQHDMSQQKPDQEDEVPAEASDILRELFGKMGQA